MSSDGPPLTDFAFVGEVRYAARLASYGWGVVPVKAVAGGISFTTSLFPKDKGYLLPLKAVVRKAGKIELGDMISVEIRVEERRF